jgi:hypothetical protein
VVLKRYFAFVVSYSFKLRNRIRNSRAPAAPQDFDGLKGSSFLLVGVPVTFGLEISEIQINW